MECAHCHAAAVVGEDVEVDAVHPWEEKVFPRPPFVEEFAG